MPVAYAPARRQLERHDGPEERVGRLDVTPAPSPVSGSAPAAPRWFRQHTAVSAWSRIALLLRPFMSTTKPDTAAVVLERGS